MFPGNIQRRQISAVSVVFYVKREVKIKSRKSSESLKTFLSILCTLNVGRSQMKTSE